MNRVIILLVVGLVAFSSAMKELNQLQQFTLDTGRLIAQWSEKVAPAEVPHTTEVQQTVVKLDSCEIKQSAPSVELPWLAHSDQKTSPKPRAVVPRPSQIIDFNKDLPEPGAIEIARLKKLPQIDIDPVRFEVRIPMDHDGDAANVLTSESSLTMFKTKTRKARDFRINTRDREILLKTLNRSINLRSAS
jgi:hypothetical protein